MWRYIRDWGLSIALAGAVYLAISAFRPKPDLPDQAPDFVLEDLDGESHVLSDYQGQWVVLNFWATWCGPCRTEIPTFNQFALDHPDVPVLGVATDGTPAGLRAFAKQQGMDYPILVADQATMAAYDVDTLPTTVVVGPDGQVETIHVGLMMDWQLEMAVD
ncbi:MAG: TlpA family protein disulfide reductase [Proteobacteria bacterium]|nr:TlpA family protein disulfide reductase [Pseudomonadota bacterium]MCP4915847.1 TlpA family protein disulfide reductase [Pseudomonadota bacterium]